jgi:hypothetical protein
MIKDIETVVLWEMQVGANQVSQNRLSGVNQIAQ